MQHEKDQASLLDIRDAALAIAEFLQDIDHDEFIEDRKTQSAVIHQLLIIGEAVKRLSDDFRTDHPEVPWSLIARTRDILVHHYEGIDIEQVWRIAVNDLPSLLESIANLLE